MVCMSVYQSPKYKDPNYILLNEREHNALNPDKQQGFRTISRDSYCVACNKRLQYNSAELCPRCRNRLIRAELFPEFGSLRIEDEDDYKQYYHLATDTLVSQLDHVMNGRFKTRTYKHKTAKMIVVMMKYLETSGSIDPQVAYRRLRYHALTERRDSLQKTLQAGKKLFDILFRYLY